MHTYFGESPNARGPTFPLLVRVFKDARDGSLMYICNMETKHAHIDIKRLRL